MVHVALGDALEILQMSSDYSRVQMRRCERKRDMNFFFFLFSKIIYRYKQHINALFTMNHFYRQLANNLVGIRDVYWTGILRTTAKNHASEKLDLNKMTCI